MITDSMRLSSTRDAKNWAQSLLDGGVEITDADTERLSEWIWDSAPHPNCSYEDHPVRSLTDDEFWSIVAGV